MQSLYRVIVVSLFSLLMLPACYHHVGGAYGGDQQDWYAAAMEACERGDRPAFLALIARAEAEGECPTFKKDTDDE